jgi:hypothetical protein
VHTDSPALAAYVPAAQAVHTEFCTEEQAVEVYVPAAHTWQAKQYVMPVSLGISHSIASYWP